jgi:hypothetical protein
MPAKLIPDKKVEMLLRRGLGPQEIVEVLAREDYISVKPEAISMWRKRRGIERLKPRYEDLLPWRVRPEHANLTPAKMLRREGRLRSGEKVSDADLAELNRWKTKLSNSGAVVHYEPASDQGWFYVTRRDEDLDIIRDPSVRK